MEAAIAKFEIGPSDDCLFLAKGLPPRSKVSKGNAASAMDLSKWDLPNLSHASNRIKMVMPLTYDSEHNAIIPGKPAVFLTAPIKMKKGDFVLLG